MDIYRSEINGHTPVFHVKRFDGGPKLEDCSRFFPGRNDLSYVVIDGNQFSVPGGFHVASDRNEPVVFYRRGRTDGKVRIIAMGVTQKVVDAIDIPAAYRS